MYQLLVVCNRPSANLEKLVEAVLTGARHTDVSNVTVNFFEPLQTQPQQVLNCDGIIIGSTENFGYMSGQIKDFFERIYYPCLTETQGLPYSLFVKAGQDGAGAELSMQKIITGLRWKQVQAPLMMKGDFKKDWLMQCQEFGLYMAAGLEAGVF